MPVVLVEVGGVARSGHLYGDRTGVEYEYPDGRYESWIQAGERFVYQAPRVGYIGCGIIGEIRPSMSSGRLVCTVEDVSYFDAPVPLKDANGNYFEADPTYWRDKVYWGQGVRPLTGERFDRILAAAGVPSDPGSGSGHAAAGTYADSVTARQVERISVDAAVDAMRARFGVGVTEMPHNNPGFDLLVGPEADPIRYVEVKGTQGPAPVFFMSDGEREFSRRHHDRYTLVVVSGVDIAARGYSALAVRDGALDGNDVEMRVSQWRGRLT